MSQGSQPGNNADLAARAADPSTPQAELHQLAADQPDLRPLIAENPNAYPQLLEWLGGLSNPSIDAALARRESSPDQATRPVASPDAGQQTRAIGPTSAAERSAPADATEEFGAIREPRSHPEPEQVPPESDFDQRIYGAPMAAESAAPPAYPDYQQPVYTYPPAAYADPEDDRPRRRGGGGCAVVFLLGLITLAALVATYFLFFGNPFNGDEEEVPEVEEQAPVEDEDAQQEDDGSPEDEGAAPEDSPSPTEDEDEDADDDDPLTRPAPGDALDMASFSAPSENIHCTLGEDEVTCSIEEYFFDAPEGCDEVVTVRVSHDGTAETNCDDAVGTQGQELDYGQSTSNDDFACVAEQAHFECWSQQTGNGFQLAREYYSFVEY